MKEIRNEVIAAALTQAKQSAAQYDHLCNFSGHPDLAAMMEIVLQRSAGPAEGASDADLTYLVSALADVALTRYQRVMWDAGVEWQRQYPEVAALYS